MRFQGRTPKARAYTSAARLHCGINIPYHASVSQKGKKRSLLSVIVFMGYLTRSDRIMRMVWVIGVASVMYGGTKGVVAFNGGTPRLGRRARRGVHTSSGSASRKFRELRKWTKFWEFAEKYGTRAQIVCVSCKTIPHSDWDLWNYGGFISAYWQYYSSKLTFNPYYY